MRVVDPPSPPSPTQRSLLYLLAGVALGVALASGGGPGASHPASPTSPAFEPAPDPPRRPREAAPVAPPPVAPAADPAPLATDKELDSALALNRHELRELARALADPAAYGSVAALRRDLEAWNAARARLRQLLDEGAAPSEEPLPRLPDGLRDKVPALLQGGGLLLPVADPGQATYLPLGSAQGAGVLLLDQGGRRRIRWRVREAGVTRDVEVREDGGKDLLWVRMERGQGARVSRTSALGPAGGTWRTLLGALLSAGQVQGKVLQDVLVAPLRNGPPAGWLGWLRRALELPANPDLAEADGPVAALPEGNPLLLRSERPPPTLLDRPDLRLGDAVPPAPARGPLVLFAANGIGIYDQGWSWLVFDPGAGQAVHRLGEVRWSFVPRTDRLEPGQLGAHVRALQATAEERTRQALALISLRREIAALHGELRAKVGGLYSRDGLAAVSLREEILRRTERVQALSHLLLGPQAIARADRAVGEAERETTAVVVAVIEGMIDAGRSGPVEYLLRDDSIKEILFEAPQAHRLRLVRKFNDRFRPLGSGLFRSLSGETPRWYEAE